MPNLWRPFWRVLLVALALLTPWVLGQAADDPPPDEVFRDNSEQVLQAAGTLAGVGCTTGYGAPTVLGLLLTGEQQHLWKLQGDRAIPLRREFLRFVKDATEKDPVGVMVGENGQELEAYCEALWKASLVSIGAMANSSRRDLTIAHLLSEPRRHRGEVGHFEGEVRRIRHLDPPAMLEARDIRDLYECWIFDPKYGANPVCLVCSELPDGVERGEKLKLMGSFDAYFFKRYGYESADGKARLAPLFLGRSFLLPARAAAATGGEDPSSGWKTWLLIFLGFVLTIFVLAFVGHWWVHRGDRRVRARIREVRTREFTEPNPPAPQGTTPSAN